MKSLLLFSVIGLALVGCAPAPQPPTGAENPTAETPPAPVEPVVPLVQKVPEADAPEGVQIPEGLALKNKSFRQTDSGERRSRATYEFAQGSSESIFNSMVDALEASGFSQGEVKRTASGAVTTTFRKAGYGRVQIAASSEIGEKPKLSGAIGVLTIDWPAKADSVDR
jgi:hypothetical protein